jgi:replicative DNA helicase
MIDLAVLRIIKYRADFEKINRYIPRSAIDKRTKLLADDVAKYFAENEEAEIIDFASFRSLFYNKWHKGLSKDKCDYFNQVLEKMKTDVTDSIRKSIVNNMLELEFGTDLANLLAEYDLGEEIDLVPAVSNLVDSVKDSIERTTKFDCADFDDSTIDCEMDDRGLHWAIAEMNEFYRNILGGDQYIVAARPGVGKTTFLCQNNASMAKQMPLNKTIVWFNNESKRQRIMSRQIQSAVGKTNSELAAMKQAGTLLPAYLAVMGRKDRVQIFDVHGKNNAYLEDILESIGIDNVGAIVFDMLDKVRFPTRKDLREDQRLEELYSWARELGVRYDCPTFPTSQVSADGEGELWPNESMLKDSKTGKQGATDAIIMIGKSDDPMYARQRYISMPKTKSKREGKADMRATVTFDEDRGIYR